MIRLIRRSTLTALLPLALASTALLFAISCGTPEPETIIQTVVVEKEVEKVVEVEKEVQVVVTATPEAMVEETVDLIDLPQSKSQPGHVIFADVGSALGAITGNGGSLPDAPLGGARNWGAGESLFTPGEADWDIPMLAESWELADDLSSVTISIRQGVQFHNDWGELKAEDIAWVMNRTNPAINPGIDCGECSEPYGVVRRRSGGSD